PSFLLFSRVADGRVVVESRGTLDVLAVSLPYLLATVLPLVLLLTACGGGKKKTSAVANPHDPNYETMVICKNKDAFGADKKVPEDHVDVNDPNYQTLQVVGNKDAFGADKKK
ncbi:hypothetical protein PENTCL1PPCAC_23647, partial [Pristionchus entomophagus]